MRMTSLFGIYIIIYAMADNHVFEDEEIQDVEEADNDIQEQEPFKETKFQKLL